MPDRQPLEIGWNDIGPHYGLVRNGAIFGCRAGEVNGFFLGGNHWSYIIGHLSFVISKDARRLWQFATGKMTNDKCPMIYDQ